MKKKRQPTSVTAGGRFVTQVVVVVVVVVVLRSFLRLAVRERPAESIYSIRFLVDAGLSLVHNISH